MALSVGGYTSVNGDSNRSETLRSKSVLYVFPVDLNIPAGKNRATRHKITALNSIFDNVRFLTRNTVPAYLRWASPLVVEIMAIVFIMQHRKNLHYYVSRGGSPLLSLVLSKALGIKTFREVHADALDEIPLLSKPFWQKWILKLLARFSMLYDKMADVRLFNNPLLKEHYIEKRKGLDSDRVTYNGASLTAVSSITMVESRKKYGLELDLKYLIFTGSASVWHGVDYLVQLQKEFNSHNDSVRIICAGGRVSKSLDPSGLIINYSPMNDSECSELIKAANASLLPVKDVRVSPGSPLKLYDYMINGAPVICQEKMPGYSDEVLRYCSGITVDFKLPKEARGKIVAFLGDYNALNMASMNSSLAAKSNLLWEHRVTSWFADC